MHNLGKIAMSSHPEAVSAGTRDTEVDRTAVEEVDYLAVAPSREADSELSLRSVDIYLPDQPVGVNGQPFRINIDEKRLMTAINEVAESHGGMKDLYPRQLVVELVPGQSTVELGEDLQPKITNLSENEQPPVLSMFKDGGTAININIPGELKSAEYSDTELIELLTRQANKDLLIALGQNLKAKDRYHVGLRLSGLAIAIAAGEGVGIAFSEDVLQMLGRGAGGALVGGAVAFGGLLAYDKARWGENVNNLPAWAVRKSRSFQEMHWQLEKTAKVGPIISLEAIAQEQ